MPLATEPAPAIYYNKFSTAVQLYLQCHVLPKVHTKILVLGVYNSSQHIFKINMVQPALRIDIEKHLYRPGRRDTTPRSVADREIAVVLSLDDPQQHSNVQHRDSELSQRKSGAGTHL